MDYYSQKAKKMYDLYLKGERCKKVYAAVQDKDRFVVIKNVEGKKWKYQLAGGGVEDDETNQEAIVREVFEELNINSKVVKSLGLINYKTSWQYEDKDFTIDNEAEVFLCKFVSCTNKKQFGLDGEFVENQNMKGIVSISAEEMCSNVYEFACCGIKLTF